MHIAEMYARAMRPRSTGSGMVFIGIDKLTDTYSVKQISANTHPNFVISGKNMEIVREMSIVMVRG